MSFHLKLNYELEIRLYRNTRKLATFYPDWSYPYWLTTYKGSTGLRTERWWVHYRIVKDKVDYIYRDGSLQPTGVLKYELMKKKWLK